MQHPLEKRELKNEVIRVPRKVAQDMVRHKHYRAFLVFLQLKPLYVSGVILNDAGNLPYARLAEYLGLSISGIRGKVKQLKSHNLLWVDSNKNFHLASYKTFVNLFQPQFLRRMRKYNYRNIASADLLIKTSVIRENYRKQEYIVRNKIIQKEIYGTVNAHVDRIKQPEGLRSIPSHSNADCHRGAPRTDLSQTAIRKIRKVLLQNYDSLLLKHKRIYLEKLEHMQDGHPDLNPYVTLSCAGLGRLFGTGANAGYYQRQMLAEANLINIKEGGFLKIFPVDTDTRKELADQGSNAFYYNYPVKRASRGREDKFFLHLPDNVGVNLNFIYENAKN